MESRKMALERTSQLSNRMLLQKMLSAQFTTVFEFSGLRIVASKMLQLKQKSKPEDFYAWTHSVALFCRCTVGFRFWVLLWSKY